MEIKIKLPWNGRFGYESITGRSVMSVVRMRDTGLDRYWSDRFQTIYDLLLSGF